MVTVLSRSESLDLVLATWRPKGDEDRFDIPDVHVFEDCECEEDWHIPVAEALKKPACDCGCGGKCTGAGGCSGGSYKSASKVATRAKKRGPASPMLATANTPAPDVQWVGLSRPLERSTERLRSTSQEQGSFVDATAQRIEVQKNGSRVDGSGDCWVSATEPPPENYEPGSPEWYAWWDGCVPTGPVGPGVDEGCYLDIVWQAAIALCSSRCQARGGVNCFGYDAVFYAWVDTACTVIDALCGTSSEGQAVWTQEYEDTFGNEGPSGEYRQDYFESIFDSFVWENEEINETDTVSATQTKSESEEWADPEQPWASPEAEREATVTDPNREWCDLCVDLYKDPCASCPDDCWYFNTGEECSPFKENQESEDRGFRGRTS